LTQPNPTFSVRCGDDLDEIAAVEGPEEPRREGYPVRVVVPLTTPLQDVEGGGSSRNKVDAVTTGIPRETDLEGRRTRFRAGIGCLLFPLKQRHRP